ncbi:MAG: ABC transporter permease [Planctomycetota bacterium]
MSLLEQIRYAGTALSGHRLRSLLCLAGMAIGVAAVVLLTALGEGARRYVIGQFSALGTNLLIVLPGKTETSGALPGIGGVPNDLTLDDARALSRAIPQARLVVPVSMGTETVRHGERSRQVPVVGTTRDWLQARTLSMHSGRFLPAGDMDRGAPLVVLGRNVAGELFPGDSPVGGVVRVGGWRMRVIGVIGEEGTNIGLDMDDVAIVPVALGLRMFNRSSLFRVLIQVGVHQELEETRRRVRAILTERHGEEDITCITQDAVISSFTSILGALTAALAGIAAISLSVAGIGIMNVMLVAVSERTREVGLLKALGARRGQITGVFLTEAALLSLAGGVLGLGLGWAGVRLIVRLYPVLPAAVTGLLFGVLPARRAARLDPVLALTGK